MNYEDFNKKNDVEVESAYYGRNACLFFGLSCGAEYQEQTKQRRTRYFEPKLVKEIIAREDLIF